MFSLINKEKAIRKQNLRRRELLLNMYRFETVGRVTFIGRANDHDGNWDRKDWGLQDDVVICFLGNNGEYYRGIISGLDLALCCFSPHYGQAYRFRSRDLLQRRNNYTLVKLSEVVSV